MQLGFVAVLLNPEIAGSAAAPNDLAAVDLPVGFLADRPNSLAAIQSTANALWFVLFVVQAAIKSRYFAETNFVFVPKSFSVQPVSFLPVAILAVAVSIAESNAETTHWSQLSHVPKWSAQSAPI